MEIVQSEKAIQAQILGYLQSKGYFVWRNNTGKITQEYKGKVRQFSMGLKGSADIIGMTKTGQFLAIEVKTPKTKQNLNQIEFEREVKKNNGLYYVLRSVEEAQCYL